MRSATRITASAVIAIAVVALGSWIAVRSPEARARFETAVRGVWSALGGAQGGSTPGVAASGFIEAEQVRVSAVQGGRVVSIAVDEGDEAVQGQILIRLDDSLHRSRIRLAESELAVARAVLDQVREGASQATLRRAEAEAEQARVVRSVAETAWQDTLAMLENPQELELSLVAARGELAVLQHQEERARAVANSGQVGRELADEALRALETFQEHEEWLLLGEYDIGELPPEIPLPSDPFDGEYYLGRYKIVIHQGTVTVYVRATVSVPSDKLVEAREQQAAATYGSWTAWTLLDQATAARQGAQAVLSELDRQAESPLALVARSHAAEAQVGVAEAALERAAAQLHGLELGAMPEEIRVAQAQIEIAEAAVRALEVDLKHYVLVAPVSGLVLERAVQVGEVVAPGTPLLTLADLDELALKVYVSQAQLGRITIGQVVTVTTDAIPGRSFEGTVKSVASHAEFTPKNVQTHEERANLVFGVDVDLGQGAGVLAPGMPADALFAPESPSGSPSHPATHEPSSPNARAGSGNQAREAETVTASGTIEGEEGAIASELGGTVARVLVGEGDEIEVGQALLELDSSSLSAQIEQALAAEQRAQADLARVKAGAHQAEVLAAEAALSQAMAERSAAEVAVRDALAFLADPQDLAVEAARLRASAGVSETQVEQARSEVAAAEAERDRYRLRGSLEEKELYAAWDYRVAAARAALEAAEAAEQAARDELAALEIVRDNPLSIVAEVHAAQGRYDVASASVVVAQARLDELTAGPSDKAVRVAETRVEQTRAATQLLEEQLELLTLRAPIDGVVTSSLVHRGEAAAAGAALLRVVNMDEVSLVVYVGLDQMARVHPGQAVDVRVDSYPGEVFPGTVTKVAAQAEFTPDNVQAEEDRASMVFSVTVRLPNPGHRLRPGMPADAGFRSD